MPIISRASIPNHQSCGTNRRTTPKQTIINNARYFSLFPTAHNLQIQKAKTYRNNRRQQHKELIARKEKTKKKLAMYFLRRQSHPNFHPQLLHPALAHLLAQEEAVKCGSSTSNKQCKRHCRASSTSHRNNIIEEEDHFLFIRDLPGVKVEDLQVEYDTHRGYLHIEGERTRGSATPYKFEHKFMMDEKLVDSSNISATLIDGVLEVHVPKKVVAEEPRRVAVVAGAPTEVEDGNDSNHVHFAVDVPGIKVDALKVEIDDDTLTITGERVHSVRGGTSSVFNQPFALNTKRIDTSRIKAFLEDGVLTIQAPTKVPEAPRKISVRDHLVTEEKETSSPADEIGETEASQNDAICHC